MEGDTILPRAAQCWEVERRREGPAPFDVHDGVLGVTTIGHEERRFSVSELGDLARLASPRFTNLRLHRLRYRPEVLALELLAARGAVCDPLRVGFARFPIVEKDPIVPSSDPPELSPDLGLLLARTI